jgi:hypothetical protein
VRTYFQVCYKYTDGFLESQIVDRKTVQRILKNARKAFNYRKKQFSVANAIRELIDKQTVELTYCSFTITIEMVPHYMKVKKNGNMCGESKYQIVD